MASQGVTTNTASCSREVLEHVNVELARELKSAEEALVAECCKTEELAEKLSKLSVRNTNKKLKRRDKKIEDSKSQILMLHEDNQAMTKQIKLEECLECSQRACERNRVAKFRSSKHTMVISDEKNELKSRMVVMEEQFEQKIELLEVKLSDLSSKLDDAKAEHHALADRLHEVEVQKLNTKEHPRKYLDRVRQCCMELLGLNVGVKQVEPVIKSVLCNIASMDIDTIPSPSTLVSMLAEMKGLACQQLSEILKQENNLTLHSDGTSNFGVHYVGFQMSTERSAYSMGLSEMVTGSANQTLSTFKQILEDIELVAGAGVGEKIVGHIKNTMSDRHVVQKNFNSLLEDYRLQILPLVVSNWSTLSVEEQGELASLNNFFCGMHVIVGMADIASSTLLQWETSHFQSSGAEANQHGPQFVKKSESGTVRLIRTVCKALSKHGSEQSGVYQPFSNFLKSHGISRNPLAPFRGNRFNILFYDAGVVFFLAPLIQTFFTQVWQTPNRLLKAVLADITIPEHLAGVRVSQ